MAGVTGRKFAIPAIDAVERVQLTRGVHAPRQAGALLLPDGADNPEKSLPPAAGAVGEPRVSPRAGDSDSAFNPL